MLVLQRALSLEFNEYISKVKLLLNQETCDCPQRLLGDQLDSWSHESNHDLLLMDF